MGVIEKGETVPLIKEQKPEIEICSTRFVQGDYIV